MLIKRGDKIKCYAEETLSLSNYPNIEGQQEALEILNVSSHSAYDTADHISRNVSNTTRVINLYKIGTFETAIVVDLRGIDFPIAYVVRASDLAGFYNKIEEVYFKIYFGRTVVIPLYLIEPIEKLYFYSPVLEEYSSVGEDLDSGVSYLELNVNDDNVLFVDKGGNLSVYLTSLTSPPLLTGYPSWVNLTSATEEYIVFLPPIVVEQGPQRYPMQNFEFCIPVCDATVSNSIYNVSDILTNTVK